MTHIEANMVVAGAFHFSIDSSGDDISGREVGEWVNLFHKRMTVASSKNSTFAAQGLANQERLCPRVEKACGMELEELHICDFSTASKGHPDSISSADIWIRGIEVCLACAASGDERRLGTDCIDGSGMCVENMGTDAYCGLGKSVLEYEVDRYVVLKDGDIFSACEFHPERSIDFSTGNILSVEYSAITVTALPCETETLVGFVELHAGLDKVPNRTRTGFDNLLDDFPVAETCPSLQCVTHVGVEAVLVGHDGGDASLGIGGIALAELNLA